VDPEIKVVQTVSITAALPRGVVSVKDAAVYLGCARETIRRYLLDGTLAGHRQEQTPGRHGFSWMITTESLMALKSRRVPAAS
jgi:excisionase family DNA binding protein